MSATHSELWIGGDLGSYSGGGEVFVAQARRFVPGLSAASLHQLVNIQGRENGAAAVFLTGIGPVWIPIATDMTELQGVHLELAEARIGGQVIQPVDATAVQPIGFGRIKTSYR